jgi:two-component system OmpR family sensor kinase
VTRLGVRGRFALLAALLVLAVGVGVALAGYLALRGSLLGQAVRQARDQAAQLAGLVDVPGADANRNLVGLEDPALAHEFVRGGLLVQVALPDGRPVQASRGAAALVVPAGVRAACLRDGAAEARTERMALACRRAGVAAEPAGLVVAAAPLGDALATLARLRHALAIGVGAGVLLAALCALALARRALHPARDIAATAESIRSGDLGRRIGYRGPRDELGTLAEVLDACFAELEQAVTRQRRFVADASHELKTPIAAVRAHTELLRSWAATAPLARTAALASLDQAARRMGRLVADLLYLTELDRTPPTARLPVALDAVLLAVVAEAAPLRPEVPIRVRELADGVVLGDALRLQQLLLNLLDNALRASPDGEEIAVSLRVDGVTATLEIADRGPGIPAAVLPRIFDRFYSAAGENGTGLGLAIAREIARAHGGELSASSEVGAGATFTVALPVAAVSTDPHPDLTDLLSGAPSVPGAMHPPPTGGT